MCVCGGRSRELASAYLAALKRRRYAAKTLQTYGSALKDFTFFLVEASGRDPDSQREVGTANSIAFQDVNEETVEAYRLHLIERGLAPASLEVFLRAVRLFFNWLEQTGKIFLSPCRNLVLPRHTRKLLPVPSEEEICRLLARPNVATPLGLRDRALLETAYATGARREELVRMKIFDPDLVSKTIRIQGKGSKERVLPLGQPAGHWIELYLQTARPRLASESIDQEALWLGWGAVPMTGHAMNTQLKRYAASAGLDASVSLHSLRRACATHMLQHGAHPVQIQMLLGHATMKHLSQYLRLTITELKKAHKRSKPGQ